MQLTAQHKTDITGSAASLNPGGIIAYLEEGGKIAATLVLDLIKWGIIGDSSGFIAKVCNEILALP